MTRVFTCLHELLERRAGTLAVCRAAYSMLYKDACTHCVTSKHISVCCNCCCCCLQVADRGGLPAAAATAAASAAGPALAPESPGYSSGLEDLGEFWYRTGEASACCVLSFRCCPFGVC